MTRRWIERHRLGFFYALAVAITILVMAVAFLVPAAGSVLAELTAYLQREGYPANLVSIASFALTEQPIGWLILVFAAAPSLAAVVTAGLLGSGALLRLLGRLRPWVAPTARTRALRFYLILAVTSVVVMVAFYAAGSRFGSAEALAGRDAAIGSAPLVVAGMLAFGHLVDEGGTLEELGWRGFALPVLLERFGSPLGASLVLGTVWMAWHLPRELPALLAGAPLGPFLLQQTVFLLLTLALSILATWGFLETGGSALPGLLIHGGTNVWSKALAGPLYPAWHWPIDPRTAVVLVLTLIVLATRWRQLTTPIGPPGDLARGVSSPA